MDFPRGWKLVVLFLSITVIFLSMTVIFDFKNSLECLNLNLDAITQ